MVQRLSSKLMAWLYHLSQAPREPVARTRTVTTSLKRGYADDLVIVRRSGRELTARQARREFGPRWLEKVDLTGRYALTCRGRRVLENGFDVD